MWPLPITWSLRKLIIEKGPFQTILSSYPKRNQYAFNASNYQLDEKGNVYKRDWLLYSKIQNSIFCFPCSLFGSPTKILGAPSTFQLSDHNRTGFTDFKHQSRGIKNHEASQTHFSNVLSWKSYKQNLQKGNFMDELVERETVKEISFWKKVLTGILDAVMFLARNNLAFRGSSSNINDNNCGNFLSLIKLLGNYYPPLATHLDRLQKCKTSYLSPKIQNEFINLCGNTVRESILKKVRDRKYFCIMFDSTSD